MAPDLKNVLERFEKTISENEKAGVTSGSYLTQVASRKGAKPESKSLRKVAAGRPRSGVTSSRPRNFSPDSKVPSDVTVNTDSTGASSANGEDPFFHMPSSSRHSQDFADDPFEGSGGFEEGFEGSFGDFDFGEDDFGDDGFSNPDHSLQNSFSSFASGNPAHATPMVRAAASRWQHNAGMRQSSQRKLVVEDDDGFSVVQDDNSVYSRGSAKVHRPSRDTPVNADRVGCKTAIGPTQSRPSSQAGMVGRVKAAFEENEASRPSDLVRRASQHHGGSSVSGTRAPTRLPPRTNSSSNKDGGCPLSPVPVARPRTRRSTVESRREKRRERLNPDGSAATGERRSSLVGGAAESRRSSLVRPTATEQ